MMKRSKNFFKHLTLYNLYVKLKTEMIPISKFKKFTYMISYKQTFKNKFKGD